MISLIQTVDSQHEDMIHDAQMDHFGTRLATCSSDRCVKVFDVKNGTQSLIASLTGHEGPVWHVTWAHPTFGSLLASCSYDRKVIIWREADGKWESMYVYADHDSSVNSLSWAPPEFGLLLACGSSDGAVSVLTSTGEGRFSAHKIHNAHTIGCNTVSFEPSLVSGMISDGTKKRDVRKRLATGGCDNLVKIWKYIESEEKWVEEEKLEGHSDWIRDVAWAPSADLSRDTIASCSQDRRVIIWTTNEEKKWTPTILHTFDDVVWHVSWSVTGNVLAVSGGDNKVSLWQESVTGEWICISDVNKSLVQGNENVDTNHSDQCQN